MDAGRLAALVLMTLTAIGAWQTGASSAWRLVGAAILFYCWCDRHDPMIGVRSRLLGARRIHWVAGPIARIFLAAYAVAGLALLVAPEWSLAVVKAIGPQLLAIERSDWFRTVLALDAS